MPYRSEWVAPDVAVTHNGVTIWHSYKDDDYDQGAMTNWFTRSEEDTEDSAFDVRDLKLDIAEADEDKYADDEPEIGMLKHAIDQGLIFKAVTA